MSEDAGGCFLLLLVLAAGAAIYGLWDGYQPNPISDQSVKGLASLVDWTDVDYGELAKLGDVTGKSMFMKVELDNNSAKIVNTVSITANISEPNSAATGDSKYACDIPGGEVLPGTVGYCYARVGDLLIDDDISNFHIASWNFIAYGTSKPMAYAAWLHDGFYKNLALAQWAVTAPFSR